MTVERSRTLAKFPFGGASAKEGESGDTARWAPRLGISHASNFQTWLAHLLSPLRAKSCVSAATRISSPREFLLISHNVGSLQGSAANIGFHIQGFPPPPLVPKALRTALSVTKPATLKSEHTRHSPRSIGKRLAIPRSVNHCPHRKLPNTAGHTCLSCFSLAQTTAQ